ncbi:hypothetical protein [Aliidiomarina soli]|uniref:Transmembrane protein n=1 Tax=Aliidiomarina soli TaxID=1928574 RepID=A0A432WIU7_9GAMM|nr:hypothetical protein [Aliidiomarina soli]RUO33730.1 hypothetical protein CWE14_04500 [Aliidiomarina soli]
MPIYRGIDNGKGQRKFRFYANEILSSRRYNKEHGSAVLIGEKTYNRLYQGITDKTIGVFCDLRGDYLIYGWRPWILPMAIIALLSLGFGITALLATLTLEGEPPVWWLSWYGVGASTICAYISFFGYAHSPFSHYIVFDRRNKLVHLPRWLSHKQDSIRWDDADIAVIDMPSGILGETTDTELHVLPPPVSFNKHGTRRWFRHFKFHFDSKAPHELKAYNGYTVDGAEAVYRFIVDFMTKPREQSIALDAICSHDLDIELEIYGDNDFEKAVSKYKKLWSLIDPERLPTESNWERNSDGNWQQIRPAVRARFGWFGLWNKSYTLPPHLRGTKADPDYKDDPNAPLPVSRWYSIEDEGTGELVGQPPAVIASVLRGDGMPDKASLERTRLKEGGWPGIRRDWWYQQFEEKRSDINSSKQKNSNVHIKQEAL